MSSPSAQPDSHGSFSQENLPQAVVRAGKFYLCSSCGTLVEIPPDVVGKLGWAEQPPQQSRPQPLAEEAPSGEASSPKGVRVMPTFRFPVPTQERPAASQERPQRPPQPKRPQPPARPTWAGKAVDGLTVPSGKQLDQAFKWIAFHLKVLDRQNSEIKRLKKLLKTEQRKTKSNIRVPRPSSLGRTGKATQQEAVELDIPTAKEHAHADVSLSDNSIQEKAYCIAV